jgi:hypothetical protein
MGDVFQRAFAITAEGIYFVPGRAQHVLRLLDFASGKERDVVSVAEHQVFSRGGGPEASNRDS